MNNTLFLLISCSLDKTRDEVFDKVSKNLIRQNKKFKFFHNLLVFDNASTQLKTLNCLKLFPNVLKCNKNIGLWSAVSWSLNNYKKYFKKKFKYVYLMESDCIHFDLNKLNEAELFLDKNKNFGSVRCQKFSVFFKKFFDKDSIFSKYARNPIRMRSYPSNNPAYFKKAQYYKNIFLSNLHAKLVGLNRIEMLIDILQVLAKKKELTEAEFFRQYWKKYDQIGLINGGTFSEIAGRNMNGKIFMASTVETLGGKKIGYVSTRETKLHKKGFKIRLLCN